MKVALPHWQGRVSPVFDVAGAVLVVDFDDGAERGRREVALDMEAPHLRAARLVQAGAEVLICGAISRPLEMAVAQAGIEVIAQICGNVEQVLAAFIDGSLQQGGFLMPGCCGRQRRMRGRHGRGGAWPAAQVEKRT